SVRVKVICTEVLPTAIVELPLGGDGRFETVNESTGTGTVGCNPLALIAVRLTTLSVPLRLFVLRGTHSVALSPQKCLSVSLEALYGQPLLLPLHENR